MSLVRPHYGCVLLYGLFHRLEGKGGTQTGADACRQVRSGELWGCPSRYSGGVPLAQAHHGPLPMGASGIEFVAFAAPDKRWGAVEWRTPVLSSAGMPLVWTATDPRLGPVVQVRIAVTRVTQSF